MTTQGATRFVTFPDQKVKRRMLRRTSTVLRCVMLRFGIIAACALTSKTTLAQSSRMAVEGSIQLDGADVGTATVIRALRPDGSVARTITPYPTNPSRFGVRFSSADGLRIGDEVSFRIVLSKRDSFVARIAGPPLNFAPSLPPDLAVNRILLFRNHLPQIRRPVPDTTIQEAETFRFKLTAQDADGDTLTYRFLSAPKGAWIDTRNGFLIWTPAYDQSGVHECVVGVSDGLGESYTSASRITVRNVNRPPHLTTSIDDRRIAEGEALVIQVEANDEDKDSLSYFLFEKTHKALLFSTNGVFHWQPDFESAGTYQFVAVVSDNMYADSSAPFRVVVDNTNRLPAFSHVLLDTVLVEGESIAYAFSADDPDGDHVLFELELAPEGVVLDSTGFLTWTPGFDQAGSYVVIVSAKDPFGSTESIMRVSVLNKNRPPVFVLRGEPNGMLPQQVIEGSIIDLAWPTPVDPDKDDTLRYTVRLFGGGIDTSLSDIPDTSMSVFASGRFRAGREYRWLVSVTDGYAKAELPDTFSFRILPPQVIVREDPPPTEMTFSFILSHTSSNDQNSVTTINYSLAERSAIRLAVYTMLGDRVSTIEEGEKKAGRYTTQFDAAALASGIYMFKLEAHPLEGSRLRDFVSTKKMVLVR